MIISLVIGVVSIISQWKIYKKAGKKGWECLVPIYNIIVLLQIVELPMWYIALFFVPIANIYAMFKIYIELAHKFGKSTGFGVATVFFSIVCLPILAFEKNTTYNGGNNETIQNNNTQNINNNNSLNNQNMPNNNSSSPEPIMFNQNINTAINPINPIQPQGINVTSSMENNSTEMTFNPPKESQIAPPVQGLNVIPNLGNNPQPVENNQVNNPSQTESASFEYTTNPSLSIQSDSINQNQMGQTIPTPVNDTKSELNVISNLGNIPQPVENNLSNTLDNHLPKPKTEISPFEYKQVETNAEQTTTQSVLSNSNQEIFNTQPTQGINVIPNMGVTPSPQMPDQNSGSNQNM